MKPLLLLFCYLFFIRNSLVFGQNVGGCIIDGIGDTDYASAYVLQIDDTEIETNLLTAKYTDTLSVQSCTGDTFSYFNVRADDTNFLIDTTAALADFDKNTDKTTSSISLVTLECTLTCTSGDSSLVIQFQVTDTNNHDPEFYSTSYEFKVPMPLMPLTDISVYGNPIIATDIDFSNQNVTFTISPDDFGIITSGSDSSKDYTAVFSTRNIIQLTTESKSYVITATDSGTPTRSATATVIVSIDESLSLDTPSFEQTGYSFNYSVTDNTPSLTPNLDTMSVSTIKPNELSAQLSGDYSQYFTTQFDATSRTIDLGITEPLPSVTASFFIITLSVTTDNTASTSVVIYLPNENQVPTFSNHHYTGTYDDATDTVTHENITVSSTTGTPEVTVIGDYADYFSIAYDKETTSYNVAVEKALSIIELKGHSEITVLIQAKVNNYYDVAALVLSLPQHILQFTDILYKATYNTDNTVAIDEGNPIAFTTDGGKVSINIADNYSENFAVNLNSETNQWIISVLKVLSDEELKEGKEILLSLTASDEYDNEAQSVVVIELPKTDTATPTFSEIVYIANYTDESSGANIKLETDIVIRNIDQSLVTITLDSYTEYFNISYQDGIWAIKVTKSLDEDTLVSEKELLITLTASEDSGDVIDQAILVVHWSVKEALHFSKEYYKGVYPDSGEGTIELDEAINFTNAEHPEDVVFTLSSYQDNFEVTYTTDGWIVTITNSLDNFILSNNSELIIVLSATEDKSTKEGSSVLVIQLPSDTLQFSAPYYIATYTSGDTPVITLEQPIELLNADSKSIDITLDSDEYADYFNISLKDDTYVVGVVTPLPSDILQNENNVILTLVAAVGDIQSFATLVINLPQSQEISILFSNTLYAAVYKVVDGKGDFSVNGTIEVETDEEDSVIEPSFSSSTGYESYFQISYANKIVTVTADEIPTDVLRTNAFIPLILTVGISSTTAQASSVLNVEINYEEDEPSIEFSSVLYDGKYEVSNGEANLTITDKIEIVTDESDDSVKVNITNEYANYFSVDYSNHEVTIEISTPLTSEILTSLSIIPLTLQATVAGTNYISLAVLNIEIKYEDDSDTDSIQFNSVLYTGQYSVENNKGNLEISDSITVATNRPDDIEASISDDSVYKEYFNIAYAEKEVSVTLKDDLPLDILEKNAFIALTLIVEIKETTHRSSAVLNINVDYEQQQRSISFSNILYVGTYEVTDGEDVLTINDTISVVTDEPDANVNVQIINEYSDYFSVTYSSNLVTVDLKQNLSAEIVEKESFIALTLEVGIKDTVQTDSAVININIISDGNDSQRSVAFTRVLYTGKYEVIEDTATITIEDPIGLNSDESDNNIIVTITNEYAEYFTVEYYEKVVSIDIKTPLSAEIIASLSVIPLTLQAQITETSLVASAVLNLEINSDSEDDTDTVQFTSVLYTGDYSVKNENGILNINDTINIITNRPDSDIELKISEDSEYVDYFTVSYLNKVVTVALKTNLSTEVVQNRHFIALTLVVGIRDTVHSASAVLNININNDDNDNQRSLAFSNLLYTGIYEGADDSIVLTVDTIELVTDEPDNDIDVTITNEFASYFSAKYSEKVVTIDVSQPLTAEVLSNLPVIALTLEAQIKDSSVSASAVLNIEIKYDTDNDTDVVQFTSVLYTGEYTVDDGEGVLEIEDKIYVITNRPDTDIQAAISEDSEYIDYFNVSYLNKVVTVELKTSLPTEVVQSRHFIAVTLEVGIKDTLHTVSAVLNININNDDNETQGSITFSSLLYNGKYEVQDDSIVLSVDTIEIVTDEPDNDIDVTITNEYANYFSVKYSEKLVTIDVSQPLTAEVLSSLPVIPLTLQAQIKDSSVSASAVLNIEIKYDTNNDTDIIEFTSVLYTGEYTVDDGEGVLEMEDKIYIITNRPDTDIQAAISEDFPYRDYFDISYSGKTLQVDLLETLPSDVVKSNNFLALTLTVDIKNTVHMSSAVLNIEIDNGGSSTDDEDSKTELHHLRITFIVVVAILSVLLLACIAGAVAYYFLKIRSDSYSNLEDDGSGRVRFGKNSLSRSPSSNKSSAIEERRPTGFIFHPINEDVIDNTDSPNDVDKGRRKSVAFDDNVEKMQIDSIDDDTDIYSNDKSQVTHV